MRILKAKTKRYHQKFKAQHWFDVAELTLILASFVLFFGLLFLFLGLLPAFEIAGMFVLAGTLLSTAFAAYLVGCQIVSARGDTQNEEPY